MHATGVTQPFGAGFKARPVFLCYFQLMLIFLSGSDDFLARRTINQLRAKYLEKNPDGAELIHVDVEGEGFGAAWSRLLGDLQAIPLFATSRLVIVERIGLLLTAAQEELTRALTDLPDSTVLVLWDKKALPEKSELAKSLAQAQKRISVSPLVGFELARFIRSRAVALNITLEPVEIQEIIDQADGNLWWIETELLKRQNGERAVNTVTTRRLNSDVPFAIFNFVRARNWAASARQLKSDLMSGKPFELLLGGLASAVRKELRDETDRRRVTDLMIDIDVGVKTGLLDDREAILLLAASLPNTPDKRVRWEDQWGEA